MPMGTASASAEGDLYGANECIIATSRVTRSMKECASGEPSLRRRTSQTEVVAPGSLSVR
ncbi:hypothetical protein D9M70_639010 [compost metagenome]